MIDLNRVRTFPVIESNTNIRLAGGLVVQCAVTLLCMAVLLHIWNTRLTVPINYSGDTVYYLVLVKSIASGNWIWFNDSLGAPFGLDTAAWPQNILFSSIVMRIIAVFTDEPGLIINLFWIGATIVTSITSHMSLRALGIASATRVAVSTLYALLPFTFLRNTAHISLTYMFVPVIAAYALEVLAAAGTGKQTRFSRPMLALAIFACVAMGFDYIYNAFFACFFLTFAGVFGAGYGASWRPLRQVVPFILVIVVCAGLNLVPTLMTWYSHGVPPNMNVKIPSEAEFYGLKIRQLLSSTVTDPYSKNVLFPLENENETARLGLVLGVGYVAALVYGLFGTRVSGRNYLWSAGVLTLAGTLLATIGGFGAIFAYLVSPDIRAYNRISVFLAFFAAFVLSDRLDLLRRTMSDRYGSKSVAAFGSILTLLFLGALADQGQSANRIRHQYALDEARFDEERDMVERIETSVAGVRRIYQLPNVVFPPGPGTDDRVLYDHGRPYLWSKHLIWSWPSFSYRYQTWVKAIGAPQGADFIVNLLASGFDGIWLDRSGYDEADFSALQTNMIMKLGRPTFISTSGRYLFFNLLKQREEWVASTPEVKREETRLELTEAVSVKFDRGFYNEEKYGDNSSFRWSEKSSSLYIDNPSAVTRRILITARVQSNPQGKLHIDVNGVSTTIELENGAGEINLPLVALPGRQTKVEFLFEGAQIAAPQDPRRMYFSLISTTIKEVK